MYSYNLHITCTQWHQKYYNVSGSCCIHSNLSHDIFAVKYLQPSCICKGICTSGHYDTCLPNRVVYEYTVNNKSFEGEKFCDFLDSSGMRGKVSRFFLSPPSYIHGFPTLQNSYERFNENFEFLMWILLKTVISILGNGQEYIIKTCVCRFHTFQDDHAVTGGEELQLKWVRDETDC